MARNLDRRMNAGQSNVSPFQRPPGLPLQDSPNSTLQGAPSPSGTSPAQSPMGFMSPLHLTPPGTGIPPDYSRYPSHNSLPPSFLGQGMGMPRPPMAYSVKDGTPPLRPGSGGRYTDAPTSFAGRQQPLDGVHSIGSSSGGDSISGLAERIKLMKGMME
eukprot:TRINITY_DN5610_c0_g1_i1.p1 TRINITY_DN5610_c0_g1~~TRINITY_DN5610_c0_g1_i1.p1  ORF type:complete len:181 (+),score=33.35 TRINITY_DN5610_c0_g1_i1:69-545(+)